MKAIVEIYADNLLVKKQANWAHNGNFIWREQDRLRITEILKNKVVKISGNLLNYPIFAEYDENTEKIKICRYFYNEIPDIKIEFI